MESLSRRFFAYFRTPNNKLLAAFLSSLLLIPPTLPPLLSPCFFPFHITSMIPTPQQDKVRRGARRKATWLIKGDSQGAGMSDAGGLSTQRGK